jgi:hypothetical protein
MSVPMASARSMRFSNRLRPFRASRSRTTLALAAVFTLYWLVMLRLDQLTNLEGQLAISTTAWLFLAGALRLSPPEERLQVISMVIVATLCECVGSLLLGAYVYRLENLPLFVPAGHGLFFLVALRLSALPVIVRQGRAMVGIVFLGSVALAARAAFFLPVVDQFGLFTWLVLIRFLFRGRAPGFYAISFGLTMLLEFYGTSLGNWAWRPISPLLGLAAANPPAAVGVGYCCMDSIARRLAPQLACAWANCRLRINLFRGWPRTSVGAER